MATATLNSHIYAALSLLEKSGSAYLAIGRSSPWVDDDNPPVEEPDVNTLDEVIGYKKVRQFSLARPLEEGESTGYPVVTYGNTRWALVPKEDAYKERAHYIYIEAEILSGDFELGPYRQVGIHFDLKPRSGVTKQNLLPSEVEDTGILHFYENKKPQNRTESVHILEQFIIRA